MACTRAASDTGTVVVVVDSTAAGERVEVLALPVDPATLASDPAPGPSSSLPRRTRDSLARYEAVADSAATLDARFQQERAALNAEARALAPLDRRSRAYATRYDAFRRRARAAEALRDARDRARKTAGRLRARLARLLPDDSAAATRPRPALDTVRAGARVATRTAARDGAARLTLATGRWWLVAVPGGATPALPAPFVSVDVRAGASDTVHVAAPAPR